MNGFVRYTKVAWVTGHAIPVPNHKIFDIVCNGGSIVDRATGTRGFDETLTRAGSAIETQGCLHARSTLFSKATDDTRPARLLAQRLETVLNETGLTARHAQHGGLGHPAAVRSRETRRRALRPRASHPSPSPLSRHPPPWRGRLGPVPPESVKFKQHAKYTQDGLLQPQRETTKTPLGHWPSGVFGGGRGKD